MSILKKPLITEKMTKAGEKLGHYGFVVDYKANKIEIKVAVEKMYGVTVANVNTNNYIGKIKSRNTKAGVVSGLAGNNKIAIVSLKAGETIDFYSNI